MSKNDIFSMADFLVEQEPMLFDPARPKEDENSEKEIAQTLLRCQEAPVIASFLALQEGDARRAMRYFSFWIRYCKRFLESKISMEPCYHIVALFLRLGHWQVAEDFAREQIAAQPSNEDAMFFLGVALLGKGDAEGASAAWEKALECKHSFTEAKRNLAYLATGGRDVRQLPCRIPHEDLMCASDCDGLDFPVFINSRDRVNCLRQLVEWLLAAGHRRIVILDNDSDYPPLLAYYNELAKEDAVHVAYLHKNGGHTAIWDSGILEQMNVTMPYVYTDSDVVPTEECPPDAVRHFFGILRRYPFLDKVGFGLRLDDFHGSGTEPMKAHERKYYRYPLEKDVYFSQIDTTFALYRNVRHYVISLTARTTGAYMARHLPWYKSYTVSSEDERYYRARASKSSTMARMDQGEALRTPGGGFF